MSEHFSGDRPISHPNDDAFGLASFSDALATSLLQMSPKDGLVISVEGPWGAGKSSAIAMALRAIKLKVLVDLGEDKDTVAELAAKELEAKWAEKFKKRKTHIVLFNPWIFSGQENLVKVFFKELETQLKGQKIGWLRRSFGNFLGCIAWIFNFFGISASFLTANSIPGVAAAAGAIGREIGEVGKRINRSEGTIENFRKKLIEKLRASDQRIIVIIDDIDRLMPSEMREVLSLVKSLGYLPNVLYVLAFDETVIAKALEEGPEKVDPAFLEKIVQVSLKLPPPWRAELRQMLFARLDSIVGQVDPADPERWRQLVFGVIDSYIETPRDVARLANTLQVIWPNVKREVDLADLIAITTLQLFDPYVYALIRKEIEKITYANYSFETANDLAARIVPELARKPKVAKDAMALMFPRLAKAWGMFISFDTDELSIKEQRRIGTREYHRNYFIFEPDIRAIRREDIEAILTSRVPALVLASTLRRLSEDPASGQQASVPAFLVQMTAAVNASPRLNPELLCAILDHSDDLIRREDEVWEFIPTRNINRLVSLVSLGVSKLGGAERSDILDILVSHKTGLQLRADVVEDDARRHGHFGWRQGDKAQRLFAAYKIMDAALSIRDEIAKACEDGSIWNAPIPLRLVWSWWRMEGGQRLTDWVNKVITDDDLVVRLANNLPGRSYRTGGGKAPNVVWTFNRDEWGKLLDVDLLFERLERIAPSNADAADALKNLREAEAAYKN